jgi:CTP:molybdopterin cytidylyltransferase MocA
VIACAILAAGASRRLGNPKQLVMIRGKPLLRLVVEGARTPLITDTAVVLGADAARVAEAALPEGTAWIDNDGWEEGIASSVRCAVAWASARSADALVLVLGDQVMLHGAHLEHLVEAWRAGAPAVGSLYSEVAGAPALFDRALFSELSCLHGDQGAGRILRARSDTKAVPWPEGALDLDTEDDLASRLRNLPPRSV